jgi:hypothetical protein
MSSKAALRELERANAYLKRSRAALKQAKDDPSLSPRVFQMGWEGLRQAYVVIAQIPIEAADDAVLTRAIAVQRYATALLVRLRRLKHQGVVDDDVASGEDEWSSDEE